MNPLPTHYADCDIPVPERILLCCIYGEVTDTSLGIDRNSLGRARIT
jgi:hypothetical protein